MKLKIKRAGIFNPYLDTLGGGEKYCLTLAELLIKNGWVVDFFWKGKDLRPKIKERFAIEAKRVNFVSVPKKLPEKLLIHRKYDLLFYLSDGSVPFMFGKRNILHLQVPFKRTNGLFLTNRIKFLTIHKVICNSFFTKKFVDKKFGVKSEVIYPPVETEKFKTDKKDNLILSVGRFSRLLQVKNQDVLIDAFKRLCLQGLRGWKFIVVGGSEIGSGNFVADLRKLANGYPVEIRENVSFDELINLYAKAKIFWAANGLGIDEEKDPEKVEHFGISVVEAMSAGAIPVIVKKGGFREIVEDGVSGFFWNSVEELNKKTLALTQINLNELQLRAIKRSKLFSKEKFCEKVNKIIL